MQRSKTLALTFLFGTLVAGGAVGFTVDRLLVRDACSADPTGRNALRDFLAERLQLTEPQRAAVDSILDDRHRRMVQVIAPVRPQLDTIRGAARAEIMKRLDPAQRARFQALIDDTRRREEADDKR